jgi:hypothetical protein
MLLQQNTPSTTTATESGFLLQSGSSITGELLSSNQSECTGLGSVQGTVSGSDIDITVNQIGQTVTLTGTAASDGSSMAGTYSILASSCSGSATGTWTASPVKPITGTYEATLNSNLFGVYGYVITVTQGPNTGVSIATLSGMMTSTNAPCGNSLSVSGVVSGTSVVFNLLNSGNALGKFSGTASTNATNITGTYDFVAQTNGCVGDSGTISMVQQQSAT